MNCYNIDTENRHKEHDRLRGVAGTRLTKEYLYKEYLISNKSLADIAKECSCSRQYVYKKIKQFNIYTRTHKEASELAFNQNKVIRTGVDENGNEKKVILDKTHVNDEFFSSWSPEMAYVLGVIYTDGTLSKWDSSTRTTTLRTTFFSIAQKEPELLNKVLRLMASNAKLYFVKSKQYESGISGERYIFTIRNVKIYKELLRLGLTPNKSRTIKFPDIPQEFVRHFIRGCWDGDGSVYIERSNNSIAASFVSGSLSFINGMLQQLETACGFTKKIYTHKGKTPSYYFRLRGSECEKLYHYLYYNVSPEQYLSRKYEIFYQYYISLESILHESYNATNPLSLFGAYSSNKGQVNISWSTKLKGPNAYVNLYRSETENGEYIKINDSPLLSKGDQAKRITYEFIDRYATGGNAYYYKLEFIHPNGYSTFHGPLDVVPR